MENAIELTPRQAFAVERCTQVNEYAEKQEEQFKEAKTLGDKSKILAEFSEWEKRAVVEIKSYGDVVNDEQIENKPALPRQAV